MALAHRFDRPESEDINNVSHFSHEGLEHLVVTYGYLAVAVAVGLESMGVTFPGETMLVPILIYAASHDGLATRRRCSI